MGNWPIKNKNMLNIKQYDQIYSLSRQVYLLQHKKNKAPSQKLFQQLFVNFLNISKKYSWAQAIPKFILKYFYDILLDLHKAQLQSMYKALNATIFTQINNQIGQYQNSFYINITNKQSPKQSLDPATMIRESILFEDQVFNMLSQNQIKAVQSVFRHSILNIGSQMKPQTNAIVMKQAIFIQNLPAKTRAQLGFYIQFYKRFAMVIESLVNSASFISLPLRHFQLSMKQKKIRKKLKVIKDHQLKKILVENPEGQERRRIQKYNQKLLLQQISDFTQVYTQLLWNFYNLQKINQTKYSKLINYQNIYNLMTSVVWMRCDWVGQRGWEYQQYLTELYLKCSGVPKGSLQITNQIHILYDNLPYTPIKHLKHIVLIYRQILKLSKQMTADDLMLSYNRLFYQMAIRKKIKRLFRMIEIVNTLWKGQKFGEVGYAWITWQASLQMLLKESKKYSLVQLERKLKKNQQIRNSLKLN